MCFPPSQNIRKKYWSYQTNWADFKDSISFDLFRFPTKAIEQTLKVLSHLFCSDFLISYTSIKVVPTVNLTATSETDFVQQSLLHKLFSDLVYVSTHLTTLFETDIKSLFHSLFQTFLPCSRKPTLFGHVVAILHEAWQMVSTISRSKFLWHKPLPIVTQTIWKCGGKFCDGFYVLF